MSSQRYERVANLDEDDHSSPMNSETPYSQNNNIPSSPPPSFRSHVSSRRSSGQHHASESDAERSLADAFAGPTDDEEEEDEHNDQARLVRQSEVSGDDELRSGNTHRRVTELPTFTSSSSRVYGGGNGSTRDGVFANLSAKPIAGEDLEEKPPTYEQAAADATPPYWETTILAPGGYSSDDVFVDGLLVGSLFSFIWNALISMSFQLIGFLLTYLLHTTHAAKHGSRAGLGITLIQYGFTMRSVPSSGGDPNAPSDGPGSVPSNPNDHDFDPNVVAGDAGSGGGLSTGLTTSDWISYVLMIVGWFILIRAVSDFVRARRQEQLVRASPDRGLPVPVIAAGEGENAA